MTEQVPATQAVTAAPPPGAGAVAEPQVEAEQTQLDVAHGFMQDKNGAIIPSTCESCSVDFKLGGFKVIHGQRVCAKCATELHSGSSSESANDPLMPPTKQRVRKRQRPATPPAAGLLAAENGHLMNSNNGVVSVHPRNVVKSMPVQTTITPMGCFTSASVWECQPRGKKTCTTAPHVDPRTLGNGSADELAVQPEAHHSDTDRPATESAPVPEDLRASIQKIQRLRRNPVLPDVPYTLEEMTLWTCLHLVMFVRPTWVTMTTDCVTWFIRYALRICL